MANGTYLRFNHKCDIYKRIVKPNESGQKVGTFSVVNIQAPCVFQSSSSERRVAPYIDNVDEFQIIVPHPVQDDITYQGRVAHICDRYGNVIEEGPFEITQIEKKVGFNGKVHHLVIDIRLVVEGV
jgi:hypothetical protein